jgi:hypothetical protein
VPPVVLVSADSSRSPSSAATDAKVKVRRMGAWVLVAVGKVVRVAVGKAVRVGALPESRSAGVKRSPRAGVPGLGSGYIHPA